MFKLWWGTWLVCMISLEVTNWLSNVQNNLHNYSAVCPVTDKTFTFVNWIILMLERVVRAWKVVEDHKLHSWSHFYSSDEEKNLH